MRIVFLDIDGVLLSTRAWLLPSNLELASRLRTLQRGQAMEIMARDVVFDPASVALVNRLCERTGASIVVHSNWRRNVGLEQTRTALLAQGIEERHLHEDWACSWRLSSEKGHDIASWVEDHRLTARPERPQCDAPREEWNAWMRTAEDFGFAFALLEDEPLCSFENVRVQVDGGEGLSLAAYRHACAYLGGLDPELGVHVVSAGDQAAVLKAWKGNAFESARWLHASTGGGWSPARRLQPEADREGDAARYLLGYRIDPAAEALTRRESVLKQLCKDTAHLRRRRQTTPSSRP